MRLFELAFLSLVILASLHLFSLPGQYRILPGSFSVGIGLILILQITLEGFRWQLLPACFLAAVFLFLVRKNVHMTEWLSSRKIRVFYIIFLSAWIPVTILLPILFPVFHLPVPGGSYSVGKAAYHLDPVSYHEAETARKIDVTIWYPASESTGKKEPYFSNLSELKKNLLVHYNIPPIFVSYLKHVTANSQYGIPVAERTSGFPVLLLSPGIPETGFMFSGMAEELASHGYIILAIDHPPLPGNKKKRDDKDSLLSSTWTADQQQVINSLYSSQENEWLRKKADLTKLGIIGHGVGGTAALRTLHTDVRIKTAANLDGTYFSAEESAMDKPFLYAAPEKAVAEANRKDKQPRSASSAATIIAINGIRHLSFTDYYLYSPFFSIKDKVNQGKDREVINQLLLRFFDNYLLTEAKTSSQG